MSELGIGKNDRGVRTRDDLWTEYTARLIVMLGMYGKNDKIPWTLYCMV